MMRDNHCRMDYEINTIAILNEIIVKKLNSYNVGLCELDGNSKNNAPRGHFWTD